MKFFLNFKYKKQCGKNLGIDNYKEGRKFGNK